MLVVQPQRQIVEKVLKTKAGIYVRAVFLLTEINGKVHVKLLSATPISAESKPVVEALSGNTEKFQFELDKTFGEKPSIFHLTDFTFLMSQPTRAPSAN